MARTLTFKRGIGAYKVGETHDVDNNTTAQYFIDNHFATEEIVDEGCVGCKSKEETTETQDKAVEKVKETKKPRK